MGMIPRKSLNVRRFDGSYVNGKWIQGSSSPFGILASVQPIDSRDLNSLPEGRRASGEGYRLYTDLNVLLKTVTDSENPDIVEIYGDDFELFSSQIWGNNIINHNKYIAVRKTNK